MTTTPKFTRIAHRNRGLSVIDPNQASCPKQKVNMDIQRAHKEFVQDLCDQKRSVYTILAYQKDIDQLIDHLLKAGVTKASEAKVDHLVKYIDKLYVVDGLTPKTVSRKINSIKTFFKYLAKKGALEENIAYQIKHPKLEKKAPRILSRVEYNALRETARKDSKYLTMVEVLLQTGVGISELAGIEKTHLDLSDKPTLFVPKRESQKERIIPLSKKTTDILQKLLEEHKHKESKYVFSSKSGKALLIRNIRGAMERLFEKTGLENVTVNDLRHTFTAHQIKAGVSLQTLSRVAGHKTLATTQKYLKYVELDKAGNKELLEDL